MSLPSDKELKRYMELRKSGVSIAVATDLAVKAPHYKPRRKKKK